MLTVILSVLLSFVLYCWWNWSKKKSDFGTPPQHPGYIPILGNAHQFLGSNIKLWEYMKELSYFSLKCGGVSVCYLGPWKPIYVLTDPDDCLALSNACLDKPFVYDFIKEWTTYGLVGADVLIWKPHRKLLNPMFSQQRMNEYLEVFNIQARRLVDLMSVELGKGKFNTHTYFKTYAQESICQIMLGASDELTDKIKRYGEAVDNLLQIFIIRSQKLWLNIPFIYNRSSYKTKLRSSLKVTSEIINEIIQNKKAEIRTDKINASITEPLFETMLKLQETQSTFTDTAIREHLEMLIFTGFDSIMETLTFSMKMIGSNQQVQQRIYEELQEVFGDKSIDMDRYNLNQLVYLDAVIKETLRICTTVPFMARKTLKDIKIKQYTLRAGSVLAFSSFGIHRHPVWGPDVEEFRPERWLDPSATCNKNPNLFAAFSLGKRNCIGKLYAMTSIKTTLAHLLRHYRILADDTKMTIKYEVALRSINGHEISLERR